MDSDDDGNRSKYEAYLKELFNKYNRTAQKEFCGLSPLQMMRIIYYNEFKQLEPFLSFKKDISEKLLMKVPVMKLEEKLIELVEKNNGKIGLTNKGNLKLSITKKIFNDCKFLNENGRYDYFTKGIFSLRSEEHIPYLFRLRNLITMNKSYFTEKSTYITYKKKKIDRSTPVERYLEYMFILGRFLNWSYFYRYGHIYSIIRNGWIFSLFLLHKFGDIFREYDFYASKFLEAFPEKDQWFYVDKEQYEDLYYPEDIRELNDDDNDKNRKLLYSYRTFFYMLCFGLVEEKEKREGYTFKRYVKKTEFFEEFFNFNPEL